jgi:hypothetical protein
LYAPNKQGIDLHREAVDHAVTMAWPMLMHDLKSEARMSALSYYKELADKAAGLRSALKSCQAMLDRECGRIERWDNNIHDLKDKIAALKQPRSTALTTMSLMRPVAQSMCTAGLSSCPTAPLPA